MADELCLPGYLTHNWGKIVEVSGSYPHAGGPAHSNSGVLLLRDPLQFGLTATHCQFSWCVAGRHCSSLAVSRGCVPAGGTYALGPLFACHKLAGDSTQEQEHFTRANGQKLLTRCNAIVSEALPPTLDHSALKAL